MRAIGWIGGSGRGRTIRSIVPLLVLCFAWATELYANRECFHHDLAGSSAAHAHSTGSHAGHSGSDSQPDAPDSCTCVGTCATAAPTGLPAASTTLEVLEAAAAVNPLGFSSEGLFQRDRYTLPFATAPPAL